MSRARLFLLGSPGIGYEGVPVEVDTRKAGHHLHPHLGATMPRTRALDTPRRDRVPGLSEEGFCSRGDDRSGPFSSHTGWLQEGFELGFEG